MGSKLIKEIIYENRKKKQLTQEQLADLLNVSNKTVSKWERGLSYPDILLIPNLTKILDISISELFDSNDIQPEAKESYDNSILVNFKNSSIISILLYVFSFVFPVIGWMLQNITFIYIALIIGVAMIIVSLINFILTCTKFHSFIQEKYFNVKYINSLENYIGIYTILYFIPLMILPIFFDEGIDILIMTIIYLMFLLIIILVVVKLKCKIINIVNIVFGSISFLVFIIGLLTMIEFGTLPYCLFYFISEMFNYVILFTTNKYKE